MTDGSLSRPMSSRIAEFDEPTWHAAAGTLASYALILLAMFVLLFVVPFAVFVLA